MNKKKIILVVVAALAVVAIGYQMLAGGDSKQKVTFSTAKVERTTLSESITATGTIEPVTEVEVGTQVSGIIDKIYVDYNSVVTKGQLIAEMDRVTLQSELASQRASYDGAKAEYEYQKKLYERNEKLHAKQLIADTDYEQSVYNYQKAKSAFDSSRAAVGPPWLRRSATSRTPPSPRLLTEWSSAAPWRRDKPWPLALKHRPSLPSLPT